jgi:hypothetical protein
MKTPHNHAISLKDEQDQSFWLKELYVEVLITYNNPINGSLCRGMEQPGSSSGS